MANKRKNINLTKRTGVQTIDKTFEFLTESEALKKMPELKNYQRFEFSQTVIYYSDDWFVELEFQKEYYKNWTPDKPIIPPTH